MKNLLTGVAVVAAALIVCAPAWSQPANPSSGNSMGMPGPNTGGPGLTPYNAGTPAPAATPTGRMPAGGRATSERAIIPTSPGQSPLHRHARANSHGRMTGHHGRGAQSAGDATDQLNREELARLQAGNFSNPAPTDTSGVNRMPAGGRATSQRYGQ
jgi:hypothetical protein